MFKSNVQSADPVLFLSVYLKMGSFVVQVHASSSAEIEIKCDESEFISSSESDYELASGNNCQLACAQWRPPLLDCFFIAG